MNMFDVFGNWIQVNDEKHSITIEDYGYDTGVITGTTGKHCVKCVAVNQCWFKDEIGKKPKKFDITKIEPIDYILKKITPGLYHPNCHCKEFPIFVMKIDEIKLIIPEGKIDWLFRDKLEWIVAMGYKPDDNFLEILKQKIQESYFYGNYTPHTFWCEN